MLQKESLKVVRKKKELKKNQQILRLEAQGLTNLLIG